MQRKKIKLKGMFGASSTIHSESSKTKFPNDKCACLSIKEPSTKMSALHSLTPIKHVMHLENMFYRWKFYTIKNYIATALPTWKLFSIVQYFYFNKLWHFLDILQFCRILCLKQTIKTYSLLNQIQPLGRTRPSWIPFPSLTC